MTSRPLEASWRAVGKSILARVSDTEEVYVARVIDNETAEHIIALHNEARPSRETDR
jgi:hypothetical protein